MVDSPPDPGTGATGVALPDLGKDRLLDLLTTDASALTTAMRRVLSDGARRGENYAAFGNTP